MLNLKIPMLNEHKNMQFRFRFCFIAQFIYSWCGESLLILVVSCSGVSSVSQRPSNWRCPSVRCL